MQIVPNSAPALLGESIAGLVEADGTASASWPIALAYPATPLRDLADAVHALCALHGMAPSIIDQATTAPGASGAIREWLTTAALAFDAERTFLATLTAAVGPLPSTPGQAQSEAAIVSQRHALTMLAESNRVGCAIGATASFLLEWTSIRRVLVIAGERVGVFPERSPLPGDRQTITMLNDLGGGSATRRAVTFGAQQLLAQHRGLWQLLDARASARRGN
ncbi:hypothetical protein [uncultured Sphingomonas sp.]|mgnify:FL=1|uniref:DUF6975 family protein n=1 Tax=uncultured Sphingomonas sp. TaxID=158754 RepID=UPI00262D5B91|nr:hypothetical protein [uncultured Sphingomonas sp.]